MTADVGARPLTGTGASPGAGVLEHSTPYPWPYDSAFTGGRTALLVLTTADPSPSGTDPAWPIIEALAEATTRNGGVVIDINSQRPSRHGPKVSQASPALRVTTPHHRFDAPGWDGFYGTALDHLLRTAGRDLLLLAGAWLEVGVHSTMRSANDRGYECLLVADACISGGLLTTAGAQSSIEMSGGIFGAVGRSHDLLRILDAGQPSSKPHTSELS